LSTITLGVPRNYIQSPESPIKSCNFVRCKEKPIYNPYGLITISGA